MPESILIQMRWYGVALFITPQNIILMNIAFFACNLSVKFFKPFYGRILIPLRFNIFGQQSEYGNVSGTLPPWRVVGHVNVSVGAIHNLTVFYCRQKARQITYGILNSTLLLVVRGHYVVVEVFDYIVVVFLENFFAHSKYDDPASICGTP